MPVKLRIYYILFRLNLFHVLFTKTGFYLSIFLMNNCNPVIARYIPLNVCTLLFQDVEKGWF